MFASLAQQKKYTRVFHEFYDEKPLHFGFLFGFASSNFNFDTQTPISKKDSLLFSPRNFGFQIGGIVNYALTPHWEIKSGVNIALYDRALTYTSQPKYRTLTRESTWLEVPILIKYRSTRRKNQRLYMVGGIKYGVEANVRGRSSVELSTNVSDLTLEYGLGLEQFFQFFKFTPEIRFSHGLLNKYSTPNSTVPNWYKNVNNLKTHTVGLIINFE
jgi:hypothetical protein